MQLELDQLREMHPRLDAVQAFSLAAHAAMGLARNGHDSGVAISLEIERVVSRGLLRWTSVDPASLDQYDIDRITEEGAEAVALALAHRGRGWCVVRRIQRGDHADWLLEGPGNGRRKVVALEVSGVDRGSLSPRLREKLKQVAKSTDVDQRWAGVVEFGEPRAALRSTKAERHGR